jgi:hypothetical protein
MGNAVFAYKNLADAGLVTVSSNLSLTPPQRLTSQVPQIAKKCRNNGENSWTVTVDLLGPQLVDVFALIGLNLSSAAIARLRLSMNDSSGLAGEVFDSGALPGLIDSKYGYLIRRLNAPHVARFVRFDVTEPGVPYVEAGRVLVSLGSQLGINFSPGWSRSRIDQSKPTANENGVVYIDRRAKQRQWDLSVDFLTEDEALGFTEEMSFLNGESDDVLLITDPDSTNLGRDSIWGLLTGVQSLVSPYPMPDINSRKYTIKERL